MAYTAQQLVTNALYLSGICARNLQTPTGDQIQDGLQMLNDLLNVKAFELELVPYYQYIEFDLVENQEFYYLQYVSLIESATFNLDSIRYAMFEQTRRSYYGQGRIDNISTLPFNFSQNRGLGGTLVGLYFKPDQAYKMKCMVKTFFTDVSLNTDLTDITASFSNPTSIPNYTSYTFVNNSNQGFDPGYIELLRYSLAQYFCSEYGLIFNPQSEKILQSMKRKLMYISPPDLSIISQVSLTAKNQSTYPNFGDANIGQGYRPSR